MAIENTDLLAVQRPTGPDTGLYKIEAGDLLGKTVAISSTAPSPAEEGDLWWADTDEDDGGGRLYVYTGSEWVDTSLPGNALDVDTGDTRYLSRLNNDTAEGKITFKDDIFANESIFLGTENKSRIDVAGSIFRFSTGDVPGGGWTPLKIARNHDTSKALNVTMASPKDGSSRAFHGGISTSVNIEGITAKGGNANSYNIPCTYTSALYFDNTSSCATYSHYAININRNLDNSGDGSAPDVINGYSISSAAFGMNDGTPNTAFDSTRINGFYTSLNSDTANANEVFAINSVGTAKSYFKGLTEHEGGVKVTGGDKDTIGKGLVSTSTRLSVQSNRAVDVNSAILSAYHSGNVGNALNVNSTFDFSSTLINGNIIGIQDLELLNATDNDTLSVFSSSASSTNSPSSSVGTCIGFTASSGTTYGSKLNIGFRGNLNVDGSKNYNFYAAGTAPNYFKGLTEHAAGIRVTGDSNHDGTIYSNRFHTGGSGIPTGGGGSYSYSSAQRINVSGGTNSINIYPASFKSTPVNQTTALGNYSHFSAQSFTNDPGTAVTNQRVFDCNSSLTDTATNTYGFTGRLNAGTNNNWNLYCGGSAPNYIAGNTIFGNGGPYATTNVAEIRSNGKIFATNGIVSSQDKNNSPVFDNTGGLGIILSASASIVQQFHQTDTASSAFYLNRTGSTTGKLIQFNYATAAGVTSTQAGLIRLASANSIQIIETSDYRLKENIVDLPNATDRLKAIKPYQYTFKNEPGVIHEGFVAHELQEHSVLTVTGTKDETESIGTLADYDGTVLETEVTEPSAEELEYTVEVVDETQPTIEGQEPQMVEVTRTRTWTPSGTRPVYQGVDQTKLIPLLTKALQEALDRIDQLEADHTTMMNNNSGGSY